MFDRPYDQASRWSSGSNNQVQFITLKLDKMAIVQSITFGKFHKVHICNLKEFKVYGGLTPNNMTQLLHHGLKNDPFPETFFLKHRNNNVVLPVRYIKIVPLLAWGANFHASIWYVELKGIQDESIVQRVHSDFVSFRETQAIRLCLKHFRQRNFLEAFQALQQKTDVLLEDPLLTELHRKLVIEGNFDAVEATIAEAAQNGYFDDYISSCEYTPAWRRIESTSRDGDTPGMRGGHQMCIDSEAGRIYLLGGWNATEDLADFWCYDIHEGIWILISSDTRHQKGPGPRSCHKIVFDPKYKQIYVLGRFVDDTFRGSTSLESDFYRYDIINNAWHLINRNTEKVGGPALIYDHQINIDDERQMLYVFGGREVRNQVRFPDAKVEQKHSGLYSYDIANDRWQLLRSDEKPATISEEVHLESRIGHSMLFDPKARQLYIFAGQRQTKEYRSDFYIYDIDTDSIVEISRDYTRQGGPDCGFTQRATIDPDLGEFYVFSGLMKEKAAIHETAMNAFWVYHIAREKWTKVYHNDHIDAQYWKEMANTEPQPRFAHQLVYDYVNKVHYLFGGNPGSNNDGPARLDDFWELRLVRPRAQDVLRRSRFMARKQRFKEMCMRGESLEALNYLQKDLGSIVDQSNDQESLEFRELMSNLINMNTDSNGQDPYQQRMDLYEELLEVFPPDMRQPKGHLIDLVQIDEE